MNDKNCGTCANVKVTYVLCIREFADSYMVNLTRADTPNEKCDGYSERTDSVERVALDMLALIKAARMHPIVLDPNKMPGGQIFVPLPETEFADHCRLDGFGSQGRYCC